MKPKKENTGGKKFHGRQDGEKRVKVVTKNSGRDKTNKFRNERGDSFKKDRPESKFGFSKSNPEERGKRKFTGGNQKKEGEFSGKRETGFKRNTKFGDKPPRREPGKAPLGKKYFKEEKKGDKTQPDNYKGRGKSYRKASQSLQKGAKLVSEEVRLNRYIANSGLCSRREADTMIEQGLVTINNVPVTTLGVKVNPGDEVRVDGKRINPESAVYILLNKPKGYITSTSDPEGRATVMDLIDIPGVERIYPVGRLDRNTTGVLLLTNDGELAQKLMHPSFEIRKIYKARLDRKPSKEHMVSWVNGVELEDGFMSFEQVGFVDEEDQTVLGLEVHSGRNRIVRRMFEHFSYEVVSLDRVMLGDFDHIKLGRGKWRFLSDKEIEYVERLKRMKPKKAGKR